jgi:hypothetical protein
MKKVTIVVATTIAFFFGFITVKKATIVCYCCLFFFGFVVVKKVTTIATVTFFFGSVAKKKKTTIIYITFFNGFAEKNGDDNYRHLIRWFCCKEGDDNNVIAFFYVSGVVKKVMATCNRIFF